MLHKKHDKLRISKQYILYIICIPQEPDDFNYYGSYLAQPEIRKAIHVGNLTYHSGDAVEKHLLNDVMDTVKPWITTLMENYKVILQ